MSTKPMTTTEQPSDALAGKLSAPNSNTNAVDPVPRGPGFRFGRPSTMIREVVHGAEGYPAEFAPAGTRVGRGGQNGAEVARLLEVSDQSLRLTR
jgi:hypothetical protein